MIKELEDYSWFPPILRKWQMQFISTVVNLTSIYQPLRKLSIPTHTIIDCCSGDGSVILNLNKYWNKEIIMTDKHPVNEDIKEIDVFDMQFKSDVTYTMFNAFHHFNTSQQDQLIEKLIKSEASFLFIELLQPDIFTMIKIIFTTTIGQLIIAPFIQPFSPLRLLFTYFIPVNLFTVLFDGVVSVVNSKSAKTYAQQFNGLPVECTQIKSNFMTSITCISNLKVA